MNFENYQETIKVTAVYPENVKVLYPALGLAGETGEVCEKIKKVYRDKDGVFSEETTNELKKEIGDVLWYIQALCNDLGLNMQDVAQANVDKLMDRMNRNVIHGNGDNR